MKNPTETIEFFVPPEGARYAHYIGSGDIAALHHLARYEWANRVLQDRPGTRRILDIACGAGYGAAGFAAICPAAHVVGCDYDARAVELAASRHRAANLRFVAGDMVTWRTGVTDLGTYDVVTSFDTIEHIAHRDIAFLNLCRHLTDDGVLLLSTPCIHEQTLLNAEWEHHKLEYSYHDLIALMRRFFHRVVLPTEDDFPHAGFWKHEVNGNGVLYPNVGNPLFCSGPIR